MEEAGECFLCNGKVEQEIFGNHSPSSTECTEFNKRLSPPPQMLVGSKCDGCLTFNFLFCCCSSAWVNISATEECLNLYSCGLSTQKSRVSRVSVEELSGVDGLMKSTECKLAIKLVVRDHFILVSFEA